MSDKTKRLSHHSSLITCFCGGFANAFSQTRNVHPVRGAGARRAARPAPVGGRGAAAVGRADAAHRGHALDGRVQAGMRETANARRDAAPAQAKTSKPATKKKGGFFSWIFPFGGGDKDKYADEVSTVAPGRDRQLFVDATHEARKDNYETS